MRACLSLRCLGTMPYIVTQKEILMETALWRWQLQLFIFVYVEFCSKMLTLYVIVKIMSSSNTEYTCIKKILKMCRRDTTA